MRSRERQKDRFHGPERQDQVGLPSSEVRRRDEDIPGGPDGHNEPKRQEHAARGTCPVALQEPDPDHCHHGASPVSEQVDDQESRPKALREDERPPTAFPEDRQEGNRQSDDDGCDREAEGRAADVGGQRRVHLWDANSPGTRGVILAAFAELLIDCEEDRTLRAVLVGMLREAQPAR